MNTLFSLIWGQCTRLLCAKIEAVPGFEDVSHQANSLKLFVFLKKEYYNFKSQKNPVQAKHKAKWRFYDLMQEKHSSQKAFRDCFNNCVDDIEYCGGTIVDCKDVEGELSALSLTLQTANTEQITQAKQSEKDKLLGVAYLMFVDWRQFGKLLEDTENAYLVGVDQFPKSVNDAYDCFTNWSNDRRNVMNIIGPKNDGLSFAQASGTKNAGTKLPTDQTAIQCFS